MNELEKARKVINSIDEEMAKLFEKRMIASRKIAMYKHLNNISVTDKKREEEIIERNSAYIEDSEIREYYRTYMQSLFEISKSLQKTITDKEND